MRTLHACCNRVTGYSHSIKYKRQQSAFSKPFSNVEYAGMKELGSSDSSNERRRLGVLGDLSYTLQRLAPTQQH